MINFNVTYISAIDTLTFTFTLASVTGSPNITVAEIEDSSTIIMVISLQNNNSNKILIKLLIHANLFFGMCLPDFLMF